MAESAPVCPACGATVVGPQDSCPRCHLAARLFPAVREAASPLTEADPTALRTIGELLATVDLEAPPAPVPRVDPLLARSRLLTSPGSLGPRPSAVAAPAPLAELPAVPTVTDLGELDRRREEYFALARRLGLDFSDFDERAKAAHLSLDFPSLEAVVREMFVHLTSALAEEFEATVARRNEVAAFAPTPGVDVELGAARQALGRGDLAGAQRRIAHTADELQRTEETWAVGRILVTEGEMLAATVRELGGDPGPALGPFEEGRRLVREGRREEGERLLARAAIALFTVLEPRLLDELHRMRDRLSEVRAAGLPIDQPVEEMRSVLAELRQRNYVGAIVAFRRIRAFVDHHAPAESGPLPIEAGALARSGPPA